MSKGLPRALKSAKSPIKKISIPVRALAIAVTGTSGVGYGTAVASSLPQGNILFLGAVAYMQFTTADTDVTTTFDGDYGIGTTPLTDGTITGGDVDLVPSTALGAATARVSPVVRGVSTDALGGGIIDNTAGDLEVNINLLIDDATISGAADFTVTGTIEIALLVMGDD